MHLGPVQQCFFDETVPVIKEQEAKNELQGVKVTFHWFILPPNPTPHLHPHLLFPFRHLSLPVLVFICVQVG